MEFIPQTIYELTVTMTAGPILAVTFIMHLAGSINCIDRGSGTAAPRTAISITRKKAKAIGFPSISLWGMHNYSSL
ncbi:hypothetical protein BSG1_00605 [Bacillus sp. SG-1]|nr:hypothetical protein BSG1_00605 [Bacillus sp. SG-1]